MTESQAGGREPLLSIGQVAGWLQVSIDLVYRLTRVGRLQGLKVGGVWRYRPADVEGFLDRQLEPPQRSDALPGNSGRPEDLDAGREPASAVTEMESK